MYVINIMMLNNHHLWLPVSATAIIFPSGDKASAFSNGHDIWIYGAHDIMVIAMSIMIAMLIAQGDCHASF